MSEPAQPAAAGVRLIQRALIAAQAIVGAVLMVALAAVLAGVAPSLAGAESFVVYSGSMEPAIHVGALAVVSGTRSAELRPGDVITYRTPVQPDTVVTHRLVAIESSEDGKRRYRTKGDANNVEDLVLVDPNAVLGKVIYTVPYAGYIVEFSKRPAGRVLFIALPAALLGLDFLRSRQRTRTATRTATVAESEPAPPGVSSGDSQRLSALLQRGAEALAAGHLDLATRAADGVLAADPRNEEAWILKARAAPDLEAQRMLLRTALTLNPSATQIPAVLQSLDEQAAGDFGRRATNVPATVANGRGSSGNTPSGNARGQDGDAAGR